MDSSNYVPQQICFNLQMVKELKFYNLKFRGTGIFGLYTEHSRPQNDVS